MAMAASLTLVFLVMGGAHAKPASAAPCPPPISSNSAGTVTIQGDPICASLEEDFRVYCDTGTVKFDYVVGGVQSIPANNTGVSCATTAGVHVLGNGGDDRIDLTAITPAAGFGADVRNQVDGSFQNDTVIGSPFPDLIAGDNGRDLIDPGTGRDTVTGGAGDDILMLRDGAVDTADCGDGTDAAQADQASVDSLAGCEILDRSPEPAATKAEKKCKKRHHHRCRKHNKR